MEGDQRHAPAALPPGKKPGTHFTGGWVNTRACVDGCGEEKISCIQRVRIAKPPTRSELLHRLRYPRSQNR
jgi:hypothetical protein